MGEQVRLSGETKSFGYLGHLCSQKSGVADIYDGEKNIAEPVVEKLRYVFEIINLRNLLLFDAYGRESWLN